MTLLVGDATKLPIRDSVVDLVVTSPPYDKMKRYAEGGEDSFRWDLVLDEIYRVLKPGGVCVWVVNDQTVNGSETGTSFRQALYAKEIGFLLYDTMIYAKRGFSNPSNVRYHQAFEYMFIFSKGKPKTFNPIKDRKNKYVGIHGGERSYRGEYGMRTNIWEYNTGGGNTAKDREVFKHPAPFPEKLAEDHIRSWSNPGDLVLDPMVGSGTTGVAAIRLGRDFIGVDISRDYIEMSSRRLQQCLKSA